VAVSMVLLGCGATTSKAEFRRYEEVVLAEDPGRRVTLTTRYLTDYPDGRYRDEVGRIATTERPRTIASRPDPRPPPAPSPGRAPGGHVVADAVPRALGPTTMPPAPPSTTGPVGATAALQIPDLLENTQPTSAEPVAPIVSERERSRQEAAARREAARQARAAAATERAARAEEARIAREQAAIERAARRDEEREGRWDQAVVLNRTGDLRSTFCFAVTGDYIPGDDEFENRRLEREAVATKRRALQTWYRAELRRDRDFIVNDFDFQRREFLVEFGNPAVFSTGVDGCDVYLARPSPPPEVADGESTDVMMWLSQHAGFGRAVIRIRMPNEAAAETWRRAVAPGLRAEILFHVGGSFRVGSTAYALRGLYARGYIIRLVDRAGEQLGEVRRGR